MNFSHRPATVGCLEDVFRMPEEGEHLKDDGACLECEDGPNILY